MKGVPAVYLGRIINKDHFRTYVYGVKGEKKVVESWAEFEASMQSGIWFATKEDAKASVAPVAEDVQEVKAKAKPRAKPKPKAVKVEEVVEAPQEAEIAHDALDDMVYEVTDDFLPNESK